MVVITGAAGFIGSCLVKKFNQENKMNVILADDFTRTDRQRNLLHKNIAGCTDRMLIFDFIASHRYLVDAVIHLGARTDTACQDKAILDRLNLDYSKKMWNLCTQKRIPLIYASSAATYGDGALGYKDDTAFIPQLKPLNLYGESKNDFDKWVLEQTQTPPNWVGLKFFNVYGPNEYHKQRMASVVYHAVQQIKTTGQVKLFRSHRSDVQDGEQKRDFIYVKDVVDLIWHAYTQPIQSDIYNLGSGIARSFNDLAHATFQAMDKPSNIEYIDIPADIRDSYQYFTQADMSKLRAQGYDKKFHTLEEGVQDYVGNYLSKGIYY